MSRILIVEDDDHIRSALRLMFEGEGFIVDDAPTGEVAMAMFNRMASDMAIVDIMLPGMSGFETCHALRSASDLPIVIVSARDDTADVVLGLESGADDYVTKPFVPEELLARVRAHLRTPSQTQSTRLAALGIELDQLTRRVSRDGVDVALSSKEFDLLTYFLRHPANVLSREQILSAVWGYSHDPGTNIVEVYVSYLRRKLGRPGSPAPILTVRSVGYRLAPTRA